MTTPKWKNDGGVIAARNAADSADADVRVGSLKVSGGAPAAGLIMTSDASGLGAWAVNPAIAAAAAAQSTANGAVSVNTTQTTDIATAIAAAAAAQATADAAAPLTKLPLRGHMHNEEQAVTTGTEARNTDGTYPFAGGLYTSTQNAVIEHKFTCRAGAHLVLSILSQKIATAGVVTVYLDGSLVLTQDCYAAVTDKAFKFGGTLGAIAAGDHTLEFKCATKNASSSGFIMFINFVKWVVA